MAKKYDAGVKEYRETYWLRIMVALVLGIAEIEF